MADTKITALTALTAADPANDVIPIVDVSDTTMAASGTTKKISVNNILSSSPTASGALTVTGLVTAGSATITGDLTVRTNKLAVTNTGVGFGMTPITPFSGVVGTTGAVFFRTTDPAAAVASPYIQAPTSTGFSSVSSVYGFWYQGCGIGNPALNNVSVITDSTERYKIDSTGVATWSNVGGVAGTAMTLNANGLGIGVNPVTSHNLSSAGPIAISGTNSGTRTSYISNSGSCSIYYTDGGGSGFFADFGNLIIQPRTSAARNVVIATGSTTPVERAVVKSTGQVRFVPLASDPAGAEAGDVYYNSTSNKLKCYNGTTWNDLF